MPGREHASGVVRALVCSNNPAALMQNPQIKTASPNHLSIPDSAEIAKNARTLAVSMQTQTVQRWWERPRNIFWAAFAVRVLCIGIGHTYHVRVRDDHWEFGYEAGRLARSLVTGHGYADPFNGPSGPSAWLPPLFPLIMAAAFKLFGVYTQKAVFAVMVVDSAFSALIAPAVYEIGARCFDAFGFGRRASTKAAPVALWAGWLWALYPAAIQYAIHWLWEMSLSTCLLTWAIVLALRLRRVGEETRPEPRREWLLWTPLGLLFGLIALSNATLLICFPPVLVWVIWSKGAGDAPDDAKSRNGRLAGALLACIVTVLCVVPWIVRNERTMHAFIPTRSNFGIEFWNATEWYHGALPWGSAVPLSPNDPEFKLLAQMGEVRYAKMRGAQAKANLRANPGEYIKDTALRTQYFWFIWRHPLDAKPVPETLRLWNYGFLSVTGLLGMLLALRRRVPAAWLLFACMMLMPLPYYLVTVQARFRHPIEPLICVLSVYLFRSTTPRKAGP